MSSLSSLRCVAAFLALGCVCLGCIIADAAPPSMLDGDITGELTIPKTRKPHRVSRNITVRPTATLKIERGARIAVDPGVWITLMTDIEIIGAGEERVALGPSSPRGAWGGLMIADQAELTLSDLTLSDLTITGAECGLWN